MKKMYFFSCLLSCLLTVKATGQFPDGVRISTMPEPSNILRRIDSSMQPGADPQWRLQALNTSLKQSMEMAYGNGIRHALFNLMALAYNTKNYIAAIGYSQLLQTQSNTFFHRRLICEALLVRGMSHYSLEEYENALSAYKQAFNYASDATHQAYVYGNMSSVLFNLGQHHKALFYLERAIATDSASVSGYMVWYKRAYLEKEITHDIPKALDYLAKAAEEARKPHEKANILFRRLLFMSQNGEAVQAVKLFESFPPGLLTDSLDDRWRALIWLGAGSAYKQLKNFRRATFFLEKARFSEALLEKREQRTLWHTLSELYYATGKHKEAFELHKRTHQADDSAKSQEVIYAVNQLETQYRTAQKDADLARQKMLVSESQSQLYQSRLTSAILVAALIILLLLGWLRYYYLQKKNYKLKTEQAIGRLEALLEGEERERTRLSQELHDGVNSSLAATSSFIQAMAYQTPGLSQSEPYRKAKALLTSTSMEIRSIAHNLAPHILVQKGLLYAIEEFGHNLFSEELQFSLQSSGNETALPEKFKLFFYRVTQELLHNIHKHAQASRVSLRLILTESDCSLVVEDNGIGMGKQDTDNGIGLQNIRGKLQTYGGHMDIAAASPTGTRITLRIPVK